MNEVGAWVRAVRKRLGLTQTELADRMGVAQSLVSRLESGHPGLAAQTLLEAFAALDMPLHADESGVRVGTDGERTRPTSRSDSDDSDVNETFDDLFERLRAEPKRPSM